MTYRRSSNWGSSALVAVGVVAVLILVGFWVYVSHQNKHVTAKVVDKARVCESAGGSCKYLIFTDHGTLKNSDAFLSGKFSSSDLYGRIHKGATYDFTVEGFRVPFFSKYPNIISADQQ